MLDEDGTDEAELHESGAIDIQTALLRYSKLVIVGDPGSGKSTFLKYIALMLTRSLSRRSGHRSRKALPCRAVANPDFPVLLGLGGFPETA